MNATDVVEIRKNPQVVGIARPAHLRAAARDSVSDDDGWSLEVRRGLVSAPIEVHARVEEEAAADRSTLSEPHAAVRSAVREAAFDEGVAADAQVVAGVSAGGVRHAHLVVSG